MFFLEPASNTISVLWYNLLMAKLNKIPLNKNDLHIFEVGLGSFLYGNPPTTEKPELDVALIFPDETNLDEVKKKLEKQVGLFENQTGIKVDGWIMTESGWIDRQRRVFGAFPHEPKYVTLETWEKPSYLPLIGDEFIKTNMEYCRIHPNKEGILPLTLENRFGSGIEAK